MSQKGVLLLVCLGLCIFRKRFLQGWSTAQKICIWKCIERQTRLRVERLFLGWEPRQAVINQKTIKGIRRLLVVRGGNAAHMVPMSISIHCLSHQLPRLYPTAILQSNAVWDNKRQKPSGAHLSTQVTCQPAPLPVTELSRNLPPQSGDKNLDVHQRGLRSGY